MGRDNELRRKRDWPRNIARPSLRPKSWKSDWQKRKERLRRDGRLRHAGSRSKGSAKGE